VKLLADESVDFGTVRALRAAGFDVVAVAELDPGIPDFEVAARAYREFRILLTEDKDFGQLVYATGALAHGVVFVRFPASLRPEMSSTVVDVVQRFGDRLAGQFVVLQPGKVRFSKLREE
jgi:predicted nuclease of predicted toxin-antitoxin system